MTARLGIILVAAALSAVCGCTSDEGFSLDTWMKNLGGRSPEEVLQDSVLATSADARRQALYKMSKWKKPGEGHVTLVGLSLLGDKDMMTRSQAARTLGAWADPRGVGYLSIALAGEVKGVDVAPEETGGVQLPKTPDVSKFVRGSAAEALARVASDEAVASLVQGLRHDTDLDVRMRCARALRHHRHVGAAQALLLGLADRDLGVRTTSTDSLRFMTGEDFGQDGETWNRYLSETESPLAAYGREPKVKRTTASWLDFSQERKAKIREIFSDLFPLERKEGPFD